MAGLFRLAAFLILFGLSFPVGATDDRPAVAIIIDDLGYARSAGERTVRLPGPVAMAVLPHTPHARHLAGLASEGGKEVILHLPLASTAGVASPGPGEIGLHTPEQEFRRVFRLNLAAVPGAVGVNNHMGSLLTRHPGHMRWLMEEMEDASDLFFVDSYTTAESIALEEARLHGIPATRRDVFLDDDPDKAAVLAALDRLADEARENGTAVGIGHPYPGTLAALEIWLPKLDALGLRLVPVGVIIDEQDPGGS